MIIRVVSTVSLILLLILVLYLPSAHPPERFVSQLSLEHERNSAFWGEEHALRILSRMLELHADATQASPVPETLTGFVSRSQVDSAAASEVSQVNARLFNNEYFKSTGALFVLATYRFSTFVEWLPYLCVFVFAALLDGFLRRIVKSKEFLAQPGIVRGICEPCDPDHLRHGRRLRLARHRKPTSARACPRGHRRFRQSRGRQLPSSRIAACRSSVLNGIRPDGQCSIQLKCGRCKDRDRPVAVSHLPESGRQGGANSNRQRTRHCVLRVTSRSVMSNDPVHGNPIHSLMAPY